MKKMIVGLVVAILIALAGTIYYFTGKVYEVRVHESEIQENFKGRFPVVDSVFLIFLIVLDNPRIELVDGKNRIDGGLDVDITIKIEGQKENLGGSIDISGGLRYVSETGEFYLTDPVVEHFSVKGVPEKYAGKITKALTKVLGEVFEKHPVYTLSNRNLKEAAVKMILKDMVIAGEEVVITLGI